MSKSIKIFSIILIIFSLLISFYGVYATTDINMNLESDEIIDDAETQISTDADTYTPPTSVGAVAEEGLTFSNILSILLITVGVVLILLSIAIIIRLK